MFRAKTKWTLTLIAFILIAIVLVSFGITLRNQQTTAKVNSLNYSIGGISSEGKIVESKQSIYMKDAKNVEGVEIKIVEDASITYKVAFYDEEENFVSMTDSLSVDFAEEIPENATTFRVVITPNQVDGEDVEITIFNQAKYANMLEITYNK